jgi:hypothetical protein
MSSAAQASRSQVQPLVSSFFSSLLCSQTSSPLPVSSPSTRNHTAGLSFLQKRTALCFLIFLTISTSAEIFLLAYFTYIRYDYSRLLLQPSQRPKSLSCRASIRTHSADINHVKTTQRGHQWPYLERAVAPETTRYEASSAAGAKDKFRC